jgi:hypothetical protein
MPITMLTGMSIEDFPATLAALATVVHSDEPTTKKDAATLVATVTKKLEELAEWASDFVSVVEEAQCTGTDLAEADSEDRPDCHAAFSESTDAILDALADLGIERPAS